jgi:hypothetical protein
MTEVRFLHYGDMTNVGDYLSSPRHYFNIEADSKAVIVGGGASNNFFAKRALGESGKRVAWGVGQSWPFGREPSLFDRSLKSILRRVAYDRASTRDRNLSSPALPLVPCASVFHPICSLPPGQKTTVIVNGNPRVSGDVDALRQQLSGKYPDFEFATNSLNIDEFAQIFARSAVIITNSYHAAYWGLLSGRLVHITGYSSKFTSVADLFGFPPNAVLPFVRGDVAALADAILACLVRSPLSVSDPQDARQNFRELNLSYAASLADLGIRATQKRAP